MTHTSIEPNRGSGTAGGASDRPYRRALATTVTTLVVLVAVFAGLNYLQGPKLASAQVDSSRVVAQSGQQLRLFANQSITAVRKSQVRVTPASPFTVSSSGDVIAVQFSNRLLYGTSYTVKVDGVGNGAQPRTTNFAYSFRTPAAQVYYLDRADPKTGGPDEIVKTSLTGNARTVVYSAPRIQQFVVFPQAIAVTTLGDDGTSTLSLVSLDKGFVAKLLLPGSGTIDELQGANAAGVVGLTFTSSGPAADREFNDTLMTVNLTGAQTVDPVLDLAGKPLQVLTWSFVTGSPSIVAQSTDQTVFLIDPTKPGSIVPLGQYQDLGGSAPDGKSIVVSDIYGKIAYSLSSGKETRLPSLPMAGATTYGGEAELIGSGTARVQQVAVPDSTGSGRYQSFLVLEDGTQTRMLFQPADEKGSIQGFSVSPNGQYVAVNVIPDFAASVSDNYAVDAQSTSISTIFIDIKSGTVVRSVTGFEESW